MNTGVILKESEVEQALQRLQGIDVDILLSVSRPKGMYMVEAFAAHRAFTMLQLETENPILLVDMAQQAMETQKTNRIYLRVDRLNDDLSKRALGDVISLLAIETKAVLYLAAPPSHFLRPSLAVLGIDMAKKLGLEVELLFMFSNSPESLSIFDYKNFLGWLRKYEGAEFSLQIMVTNTPVNLENMDVWMRKVWMYGVDAYMWNLQRLEQRELQKLPAGVIAVARAKEDHTSVFLDERCRSVVAKVNKDEVVYVTDYLDLKVAVTFENRFIRRYQFDIENSERK